MCKLKNNINSKKCPQTWNESHNLYIHVCSMSDSLTFYFPYLIKQLSFVILIKSFIWVYWFMITFPHLKYALSEFFNSKVWKIFKLMNPIISICVNYSLLIECIQEGNMFTGARSRMLFTYLTMRIWTSLLDLLSFF